MEQEGIRVLFGGLSLMLDQEFHKGYMTNIVNRILIMLVEDCLGQPYIYVIARNLYKNFCHQKHLGTKEAICAIVHMFALVLGTTKGRMASIVRLIKEAGSGKFSDDWCIEYRKEIATDMRAPSEENMFPLERFKALVTAGDLRNATLLDLELKLKVRLVWKALKDVLENDPLVPKSSLETIVALEELYKLKSTHAERELFLYHAIVIVTFRRNVRSWTTCCTVPDRLSDQDKVLDEFKKYLSTIDSKEAKLTVPDYCIDVHTAQGRAAGKDAAAFAVEGAMVTNADDSVVPRDLVARYEEMYVASKKAIVVFSVTKADLGAEKKQSFAQVYSSGHE